CECGMLYRAKLSADNTAVPVGGSVTLTCSVNPSSSSRWKYYWYKENYGVRERLWDAFFLSNDQVRVSQGGLYSCIGKRGRYCSELSQSVRIDTIVSNRPVVTLHPNWSEIYRGETITVRCEIHGGDTEWDYEWETNSRIKPPNQNEYRIRSASSSNSGNYRCKGRMKKFAFITCRIIVSYLVLVAKLSDEVFISLIIIVTLFFLNHVTMFFFSCNINSK
uniref:Ig-like domain-containing protein n=1 Tax=Oreochromis niloticus TaxID=8128 RepID=A0A669D8R8_ORENI